MKRILLVEPDFPIPPKSKNHKNFLPIGLLKIASYLRENGHKIILQRGKQKSNSELYELKTFNPDEIWITSIFTYWAEYVKKTVQFYKSFFPKTKTIVGGIYASLMPDHCKKYTECDEVFVGVMKEAENYIPAYDLIINCNPHPIDYQILHTSRGCERRCEFCGTWKIEPEFTAKKSIKNEIIYKKLVFYDNNLLCNPYIENILVELIKLKKEKKIIWCESQSGFDGRILFEKSYLAKMLKDAGFRYPRLSWDWNYNKDKDIKKQIEILIKSGFNTKDIFIFMIYNWKIPFEEMEQKRKKAWEWRVQISDCRFRPLNQIFDYYNPRLAQTNYDYYIHPKWSDVKVKQFRRNVRRQNICVRQGVNFYSKQMERKQVDREEARKYKKISKGKIKNILKDTWFPED